MSSHVFILTSTRARPKDLCVIIIQSTSGVVPYRYKLFWYSLHRCRTVYLHTCSGTVPIHLSTLQTERTKLYRNSLFWNENHKILSPGTVQMSDTFTDVDRWRGTVPIPYQSKTTCMDRVNRIMTLDSNHNPIFYIYQGYNIYIVYILYKCYFILRTMIAVN